MTGKRIRFIVMTVLAGVLLVGGVVSAQSQGTPPNPQQDTAQPAPNTGQQGGVTQQEAAAPVGISALGSVEANTVAALQFQTAGTVKDVYVEVGDYVQVGDVLADLDSDDAWSSYNQAALNLESANIAMAQLMEPPSEDDLRVAKANLVSAQAGYNSTANSVTPEQITAAQLKYNNALNQLNAMKDARAHMNGTDQQITLEEAQIGAASFNTEIARLQLQDLQTPNSSQLWSASLRIEQAQLQLEQLQEPPAQSQINSAQSAIDRAQLALTNAEIAVKQTQLVAPIAGYVTTLSVAADQAASPSTVAMEISDVAALHMTVPINELDIGQISEGMAATISLDALPDLSIPGKVEHVGWLSTTSSDGIVTYDVQVVLNTTDPRVRIGMTGQVTIETGSTGS